MTSSTSGIGIKSKPVRLTRSSKILKVIIKAIQDKKGEHIVSLDLRKINEAVSDFFIVCEAPSTVQVRAIADWVEVMVKQECGENPYKREGQGAQQWVLVDYVNVVVHVFLTETRKFYRLEEMWGDGESVDEIGEEEVKPKAKPAAKKAASASTKTASKRATKSAEATSATKTAKKTSTKATKSTTKK